MTLLNGLELAVEDYEYFVWDRCRILNPKTNIVAISAGDLGRYQQEDQSTRTGEARLFLLARSLQMIHGLWANGIALTLQCPNCRTHYVLGKDELSPGEQAYQRYNEAGEDEEQLGDDLSNTN